MATMRHRLTIVVGYYGSGKTEFAVNLALCLAGEGKSVTLADLDVVNPYFRSREKRMLLEKCGVELIASSQACADADVPSMPSDLNTLLQSEDTLGVLDIGGNGAGVRVLARYKTAIQAQDHQVLMVVNANRPQTRMPEQIIRCMSEIESVSGLNVTGIVNNTHMCGDTAPGDILFGASVVEEVSRQTAVPIICHMAEWHLADGLGLDSPVFSIDIHLNKPWKATTIHKKELEKCPPC